MMPLPLLLFDVIFAMPLFLRAAYARYAFIDAIATILIRYFSLLLIRFAD